MVAPDTWSAPSSGGTVATAAIVEHWVSYAQGYWFSVTSAGGSTDPELRVASDPTGTWTAVTLPSPPATYTHSAALQNGYIKVASDGTTWAFTLLYINGTLRKSRVIYSTAPTSSWSSYEFDATDAYQSQGIAYFGGTWAIYGRSGTAPRPAFIATSGTATGTYTFYTGYTGTGYDTADAGDWYLRGIVYDGSTYTSQAVETSGNTSGVRYSSSLTSSWATATLPAHDDGSDLRYSDTGYYTIRGDSNVALYATSPGGTWSTMGTAQYVLGDVVDTTGLANGGGYWIAYGGTGTTGVPHVTHLQQSSPYGTYATASADGFSDYVHDAAYANGYFVAGGYTHGELRYCYAPTAPTTARTLLRQRQSPVRSPSRVGWDNIRQRQTTYIT